MLKSKLFISMLLLLAACDSRVIDVQVNKESQMSIYNHACSDLNGNEFDFSELQGQVTLIVNVASHCGYTGQYKDLQLLNDKYEGFQVIGFPCNDFGGQEPGDAGEITDCATSYNATFPLMHKTVIANDENRDSLYQSLSVATGELPSWNFGKYLVNQEGNPVAFFGSSVAPLSDELIARLESLLNQ